MRTPEGDKICSIIRLHIGRANGISAPDICRELGWRESYERTVRRIIADESCLWSSSRRGDPGVLVCSEPSTGYFVAETYEEAHSYWNWLTDLAAVANRKVFNFQEACSEMGIKFSRNTGILPVPLSGLPACRNGSSASSVKSVAKKMNL
jgi:hypothetical protein